MPGYYAPGTNFGLVPAFFPCYDLHMKAWCYLKAHPNYKVKIDQEDLNRVSEYSWRVTLGTTGRKRVVTSYRDGKSVKTMTLGRFLMNPGKNKQVYPRRFNDSLDYRKENLVVCTLQERQQLLPKRRTGSSSRYKGVSYIQSQGLWRAGIMIDGNSVSLGDFKSEEAAALAYNKAAQENFGEFAYQNSISRPAKSRKDE